MAKEFVHKFFAEHKAQPVAAPQQPVATIVIPPQQQQVVPTTTTGGIALHTSTPVKVSSPINVSTPVSQSSNQVVEGSGNKKHALGSFGADINTLIALTNLGANIAGAAGAIVTAVPTWIDTFLPDCPPSGPAGAPVIPGCQVFNVLNNFGVNLR